MPLFDPTPDAPRLDAWRPGRLRIELRPMCADDARALGAFFDRLSHASRAARFHCGVPALPPAWLERLTRTDDPGMVVLLAVAGGTIVGEARYASQPGVGAEFAMVIADAFQGRGLGRRLLRRLVRLATVAGIDSLYGDIQRDNTPMIALARSVGFRPRRSSDPLLVTVERRRHAEARSSLCHPEARSDEGSRHHESALTESEAPRIP